MDPTQRQPLINQSTQPPPPSSSSSGNSFPILAVAILGIATTAILLLTYYVFVIKCCLNWRRSDFIRRLTTSRSLLRRYAEPATIHSAPDELLGLEPSAIRAIPIVRFTRSGGSSHECAVCLNEFDEEESLRLLPNCSHIFHVDCIDVWLQSNANCPLCRSEITAQIPFPFQSRNRSVVIEVRGDDGGDRAPGGEAASSRPDPSPRRRESNKKGKTLHRVTSMGDEFIDSRGRDERLSVQPVRRSFSMDSCCDRRIYVAVQEILQQNPESLRRVGSGEGSSGGGGAGGRVRRSFFSFGHGRSSRNSALPIRIELA